MPQELTNTLSQNISWTIQKGSWMIHFLITLLFWLTLVEVCGSKERAWQWTVVAYNLITFMFFHWLVGDPFNTEYRDFTFWEQMAVQLGQSSTLKFMAIYPVLLFMFVTRLVEWNTWIFLVAFASLVLVVVPKFGFMHMKRIFGIDRQD